MRLCPCERCIRHSIRAIGLFLDMQVSTLGAQARLIDRDQVGDQARVPWGPPQHSSREAALGVLAIDPRGALVLWPSSPGDA